MATLDTTAQLTLLELANQRGPDGNLMVVAEVLNESNPAMYDAPWIEANGTTFHKIVRRATLPSGTWRRLNGGVAVESTQTTTVQETIGMLEVYSEADVALGKMASNPAAFRTNYAKTFIEGLGQHLADTLIYGNASVDTEEFTGLAPRLNDLGQDNVISAGGSGGDTTSIFIVQWGENKVHMIYPRGNPTLGVQHTDLGEVTVSTSTTAAANQAQFQAYRDHFKVYCGLAVEDARCIARVANIESSGTSNIFDEDDVITLLNAMPNNGAGAVIYCNQTVLTQMAINAKDKSNVWYDPKAPWGAPIAYFWGHPVRRMDAIVNSETAVA